MTKPDQFELMIKMSSMGQADQPVLDVSQSVKFHQVIFDPTVLDDGGTDDDDSDYEVQPGVENGTDKPFFFKDPLCPPGFEEDDEKCEKDESFEKLGRNMRASSGKSLRNKGVCDLMNERKKLLLKQKEQALIHNKELSSEVAATALVNDLLQNGFHITPPESGALNLLPSSSPLPPSQSGSSSADEGIEIGPVEERNLVLNIHRQLKRVQGSDRPEY